MGRYRIKRETDLKKRRVLINKCLRVPSKDFHDPDFKRLFYVRYVDDWVILFAGSLEETKVIRNVVSKKITKFRFNPKYGKNSHNFTKRRKKMSFSWGGLLYSKKY